jgi:hypothetical protein
MGSLFKKAITRPLPPGAEIITRKGERLARWRDGKGKMRTAPVTTGQNGADRIRDESGTYVARYRDGNGIVVEVSTGCRDKTAAQNVLADLERQAEKVRSGLLTPAEARSSEHIARPLRDHVGAYIESMKARGVTPTHRKAANSYLNRLTQDCSFARLTDMSGRPWNAGLLRKPIPGDPHDPATLTSPRRSHSPVGAFRRAGSRHILSRASTRPMRRPTLAASAER